MVCPSCEKQIIDDAVPTAEQPAPKTGLFVGIAATVFIVIVAIALFASGAVTVRDTTGHWFLGEAYGNEGTVYPVLSYAGDKNGNVTINYGGFFDVSGTLERVGFSTGGVIYELTDLDYDPEQVGGTLDSVMMEIPNGTQGSLKGMWKLQLVRTDDGLPMYMGFWCDVLDGGMMDFGTSAPDEDLFSDDWEPDDSLSFGTDYADQGWFWEVDPQQTTKSYKSYLIARDTGDDCEWFMVRLST